MSTTLPHVKEDLAAAEVEVAKAQDAVIAALTSRTIKTTELGELEAALAAAIRNRDDLLGTRDFIIARERERGSNSVGTFSSAVYLSRRSPGVTIEDVAQLADAAQHKNESNGITGCLYVFPEWFASYIEGADRDVTKLLRSVAKDTRHTCFRIVSRDLPGTTKKRLFPKDGLQVRWCLDGVSVQSTELWKALVPYVQTQLNFLDFEPTATITAKGVGSRSYRWYILHIAGSSRYDEYVDRLLAADNAQGATESLCNVRRTIRRIVEQHTGASVLTPMGSQCLAVIPADVPPDAVVASLVELRQAIVEIEPGYFPHVAVVLTRDAQDAVVVSDGTVNVCGPALRRARILWTVAAQEDRPVLVDNTVFGELQEASACVSQGWYDFDGEAAEVYAPSAFSGESPVATWGSFIDHQLRARAKANKKRMSIAASSAARSSSGWGGATSDAPVSEYGGRRSSMGAIEYDIVSTATDPDSIVSAHKYAKAPVVGGVTEDQIRKEYDRCGPRPSDDTISITQLQKALYDIDFMGHAPSVTEIAQQLKLMGVELGGSSDEVEEGGYGERTRVNVDQFAVLWCRALLR